MEMEIREIAEKAGISFAFFCMLIFAALSIQSVHDWKKTYMGLSDVPDTSASIEVLSQHGFFGKVPQFGNGDYYFFGSMPPLHAFIGSVLDFFLNDAVASALVLNSLVCIAIAAIVLARNRDCGIGVKILAVALLVVNPFLGFTFPFVNRGRSLLAIFFLIALLYLEWKKKADWKAYLACMAGVFMSQPSVGVLAAALVAWPLVIERKEIGKLAATAGALAIGAAFQYKTILGYFELPRQAGGSVFSLSEYTTVLVCAFAFVAFWVSLDAQKRRGALPAFVFLALPILNTISFAITGDAQKTIFANIPLGSDLVYAVFLASALAFLLLRHLGSLDRNKAAAGLMFFAVGFGLLQYANDLSTAGALFDEKMKVVDGWAGITDSKMIAAMVVESQGSLQFIHGDFMFSSLSYLEGKNTSFEGTPLPPQLDRGPAFQDSLGLANALAYGNGNCTALAAGLREKGADAVAYLIVSKDESAKNAMDARSAECGLEKKEFGSIYDGALAIYKIKP